MQELLTFEGGEDLSYLIDAEVYLTPSIATKTITAYKNVNQRNNSREGFMQHIHLSQIRTWSMPLLGQPLRSLKPIPVIASTEERLDTSTIAYFENNPPCILLVIVVQDKNAWRLDLIWVTKQYWNALYIIAQKLGKGRATQYMHTRTSSPHTTSPEQPPVSFEMW